MTAPTADGPVLATMRMVEWSGGVSDLEPSTATVSRQKPPLGFQLAIVPEWRRVHCLPTEMQRVQRSPDLCPPPSAGASPLSTLFSGLIYYPLLCFAFQQAQIHHRQLEDQSGLRHAGANHLNREVQKLGGRGKCSQDSGLWTTKSKGTDFN